MAGADRQSGTDQDAHPLITERSALPSDGGSGGKTLFNVTIAIPARNEVEVIESALAALEIAGAGLPAASGVVVLANNCIDGTAAQVRRHARHASMPVRVVECDLPPPRSDAGRARRLAMAAAEGMTREDGYIVTTDADAVLMPDALRAFHERIGTGADLVCGAISTTLPPEILFAPSVQRIDRVTRSYAALAYEVRHAIDRLYGTQEDGDQPHYIEAGACMAVSARFFRRIGGLPDIARGEDRALVRRAELAGGRVVYCERAHAVVSPRLDGRAAGGMAETLLARLSEADPLADESLLSHAAIVEDWRRAVLSLGKGPRPPLRQAEPRLRASDLERDLPRLRDFVAEVVRPDLAPIRNAGALAWTA